MWPGVWPGAMRYDRASSGESMSLFTYSPNSGALSGDLTILISSLALIIVRLTQNRWCGGPVRCARVVLWSRGSAVPRSRGPVWSPSGRGLAPVYTHTRTHGHTHTHTHTHARPRIGGEESGGRPDPAPRELWQCAGVPPGEPRTFKVLSIWMMNC